MFVHYMDIVGAVLQYCTCMCSTVPTEAAYDTLISVWYDTQPNTAYHVGWLILSGEDPSVVLQRSDKPLLTPEYAYQTGKCVLLFVVT